MCRPETCFCLSHCHPGTHCCRALGDEVPARCSPSSALHSLSHRNLGPNSRARLPPLPSQPLHPSSCPGLVLSQKMSNTEQSTQRSKGAARTHRAPDTPEWLSPKPSCLLPLCSEATIQMSSHLQTSPRALNARLLCIHSSVCSAGRSVRPALTSASAGLFTRTQRGHTWGLAGCFKQLPPHAVFEFVRSHLSHRTLHSLAVDQTPEGGTEPVTRSSVSCTLQRGSRTERAQL